MKRRPMSAKSSRNVFKRGTRVNKKNGAKPMMRGGIRL